MRLFSLTVTLVAAILSMPAPAAAQTFAPIGPWELSANEDSCFLKRNFASGEDALTLELQRYFPGDIRAVIESKSLTPTKLTKIRYRLNDGAWREDVAKYNWRFKEYTKVVFFPWAFLVPQVHSGMSSTEIEGFFETEDLRSREKAGGAELKTITVDGAYENPITLRLGSMAAPIEALNKCYDDLLTIWGIDVEAQKSLTRPVRATKSTEEKVFQPTAYMVHSAKPSDLTVRLIISPTGEVESCHFDKIKSPLEAVESFCREIQRKVDFEPALDADGKGVRSTYVYRHIVPEE